MANATIYGKKTSRPLTSYEEAINRASTQLALENPLLISKKGDLFDLAKKKLLDEGYRYKRGSSRSKLREKSITPPRSSSFSQHHGHQEYSQQRAIMVKRQENAQRLSEERLEKIENLQKQVDHAIQYRQATENQLALNSACRDTLTQLAMEAELIRYEETKLKLTKEISKLKAQERKHQWYKRRKLERSTSSISQYTDEGFSSQPSSYFEEDSFHTMNNNNTLSTTSHSLNIGFSVYKPPSPASSYSTLYPSSQEYNDNDNDNDNDNEEDENDSHTLQSRNSISSQSSTATISNSLCCPRESDVRASSMNRFDR